MAYTTIDDPTIYFNTVLYAGTGSEQTVSGVNFQPDWTWLKSRSNGQPHVVSDSVRGATKQLYTADTQTETSYSQYVKSFNSDGFVLGTDSQINQSSQNFVSWNWVAGTSFTNDASATGIGSIDSTGSVNQDAGFSIVSFDLSGQSGNETIKHGLNTAPKVVITKRRSGGAGDWTSYFGAIGNSYLILSESNAGATNTSFMNNTAPTSSVFTVGDPSWWGASPFIAYCFSEKQGYSKFSTFKGNSSSDGTYIHLGFSPAFFLWKNIDSAGSWILVDAKRPGFNVINDSLNTNNNNAENTVTVCDFTSNGVKFRTNADHMNGSYNFIYMAFAENPFVTSTGVPATAR